MSSTERSLLAGIAWTGAMRWASQIISWASTLVLVRLLTPQDYGLVAMAVPIISWLSIVAGLGLQEAITTGARLERSIVQQLYGASLLTGVTLSIFCMAGAPLVSSLYGERRILPVLVTLSTVLLLEAARVVPHSFLSRELKFSLTASVDLARGITSTVTVLVAALLGARYWSLVFGQLAGGGAAAISAFWLSGLRPTLPKRGAVAPVLRRARSFLLANIGWQSYSNMDMLVAGAMLGASSTGILSLAKTLAYLPIEKLVAIVTTVTPGVMAEAAGDRKNLGRIFHQLAEGVLFVVALPLAGVAAVADLFVPLVLGERWAAAVGPLRLFCVAATMAAVGGVVGQTCNVLRGPRINMITALVAVPTSAALFWGGASAFGVSGIPLAWIALYPLLLLPPLTAIWSELGGSWRTFLSSWFPPLVAGALVLASVLVTRLLVSGHVNSWVELLAAILVGATVGSVAVLRSPSPLATRLKKGVGARVQKWFQPRLPDPPPQ